MALDAMTGFMYLISEFLRYLHSNVSSIPFSISFGAAILLTLMYLVSFISSAVIKAMLMPSWIFAAVTYFFPALIPKEHESISLIIFAAMVGLTLVVMKVRKTRLKDSRLDKASSEVVEWMKADQLLHPKIELTDRHIEDRIKKILKKNRVS